MNRYCNGFVHFLGNMLRMSEFATHSEVSDTSTDTPMDFTHLGQVYYGGKICILNSVF